MNINKNKKNWSSFLLVSVFAFAFFVSSFLVGVPKAQALACTASAGNWNTIGTWSCGRVPLAVDNVIIPNTAMTVTVDTAAVALDVTFTAGNKLDTLTISGTNSLTVTNAITINLPSGTTNKVIAVDAGSLSAGSIVLTGTSGGLNLTQITVSTGTVTVSGNITSAGVDSQIIFSNAGTLNAGGTFLSGTAGTFTPSTGTINYNAAGAQAVGAYTYNNLTLSNSGAKTTTGATVNGIISMEGTATTAGTIATYGAASTLQYKGSALQTTGTEFPATFGGSGGVIINNASGVNLGGSKAITNALTLTSGTFGVGTNTLTLNGSITVTSGTLSSGATGTVVYGAAGAQAVVAITYGNLTLSGSGAKTTTGATVNGILSMEGTATTAGTVATYGAASTLQYKGSALQTTGTEFPATWAGSGGVIINNASGVSLGGSKAITNGLTLTSGTLGVGTNTLTLNGATTVTSGTLSSGATGTVVYGAAGAQAVVAAAYGNLTFSGSGAKSVITGTSAAGALSIAPTGSATASIGPGLNIAVNSLLLAGVGKTPSTWGSTSSAATHQDNTYFAATTGYVTVATGDSTAPTVSTVAVQTGLTVNVTFSEAMGTGVTTNTNYTVTGTGIGTLSSNPNSVAFVSGSTYTLTWSSGEMKNAGNITITVANAQDSAGNTIGAPTSGTHTGGAIGVAPTVSTVAVQTGLTVNVTFSEAMGTGVTTNTNYTVTGTGIGTLSSNPNSVAFVSGSTYTLTWSSGEMFNGGNITITVANAQDSAGNTIGAPTSGTHTGGAIGVAPTVSTVAVQTGLTVDVTFSEAMVTGVTTNTNYTVTGTGIGTLASNPNSVALVSGNKYRLTWSSGEMKNGGNITITVINVQDSAGNTIGAPTSGTDTGGAIGVAPTVSTVAVQTGLTVNVVFSEPMGAGVTTNTNYTVTGTGIGTLSSNPNSVAFVSGSTYTLTWSSGEMKNAGNITITVANAQDSAGNTIGAPTSGTHTGGAIGVAPTVSTVAVQTGLTVDVTFSEAMVTGVTTNTNYTVTGTGKGTLANNPNSIALVSGNKYRLTWSSGEMFNGGNITITVANAQDSAGNVIGAPTSGTHTGGAIGVAPTVSNVAVQTGLTVNITFSEAMGTGVTTNTNYTVSGTGKGTLSNNPNTVAIVSGNTYVLTWSSGEMFNGGNITITVVNAQDLAGNTIGAPTSGTHTGGAIGTAPVVFITSPANGTRAKTSKIITFTDGETTSPQCSVDNVNWIACNSGVTVLSDIPEFSGVTEGNTFTLYLRDTDAAGNVGTDSVANVTKDNTAPTVSTVTVQTGLTVNVVFSEAMDGGVTTAANYTISGTGKGTLSNNPDTAAIVGGNTYVLTWSSGEMESGGDITITVANAQDLAGNIVGAPNSGTDIGGAIGIPPTVSTVAVQTGLTVNIIFSEAMGTGVTTAANYTVSGTGKGTLSNNPNTVGLVSGNTYVLTWSSGEMFDGGNIIITVANAQDLIGNTVGAPNSGTHTGGAIGVVPTVSITAPTTGTKVNASKIITFTDDETTSPQCSVDNTNWTACTNSVTTLGDIFEFAGLVEGNTFTLYLRDTDAAGNIGTDNVANITKDTTAPNFTMQYYSDSGLTTPAADNAKLKAGTYYVKITANEALGSTPTVSIVAEGIANDITNGATILVSGNDYKYTRTISTDAAAVGAVIEDWSVTGTDSAGNIATDVNPTNEATKAIYTDTIVPTILDVTSAKLDGTYGVDEIIDITVQFSEAMAVDTGGGTPSLSLNSFGTADYNSGSGLDTLTFRYTVVDGQNSADLDYSAINSLSLNGGYIYDLATNNADLTLPAPGAAGSLGNNKNINITTSAVPVASAPINITQATDGSGYISFETTVSEPSPLNTKAKIEYSPDNGANWYDPLLVSATPSSGSIDLDNGNAYQVGTINAIDTSTGNITLTIVWDTKSASNGGGPLDGLDNSNLKIRITVNNSAVDGPISTSNKFNVDNSLPNLVSFTSSTFDDTYGPDADINITATYDDSNMSALSSLTVVLNNGASVILNNVSGATIYGDYIVGATDSGEDITGLTVASITTESARDGWGNTRTNSAVPGSPNNLGDSKNIDIDVTGPTVTVNQAGGQADPAATSPVNFTVVFNGPINPATFTNADITQNGTAIISNWLVTDSGDQTTFTITATVPALAGTVIPSIGAGKVTDSAGNSNDASTSTDNSVTFPAFVLTYNAGVGGSITGITPQIVNSGLDGTEVVATPDSHYSFVKWSDNNSTVAARTDTNVTADITTTASFTIDTFTLTYNAGLNGLITGISPQTVDYGTDGTQVTATPDPGYHFDNWSDAYPTAARTDTNVTANKSVTANFVIDDTTPPTTTINSNPPASTTNTSATFTFSANEPSTFECKLDSGSFSSCTSPVNYSGLSVTSHTFYVQATDLALNPEAPAKSYAWTITSGGGGGGGGFIPAPKPTDFFVKINNGASQATSSNVVLTLSGVSVTGMLISNYSNFSGSNWETYATAKNWVLLPGEGNRTVYVKFRGNSGEIQQVFSAVINIVAVSVPIIKPPIQATTTPATTTPALEIPSCDPYLLKDIYQNAYNDPNEVQKLQIFLRDYEGFTALKITGLYSTSTIEAVKQFQAKYAAQILTPSGFSAPTGMVSKFTINEVNVLYCKGINQLAQQLPAAQPPVTADVLTKIASETQILSADNREILLAYLGSGVDIAAEKASLIKYAAILNLDSKINAVEKTTINNFIVYGTPSTKRLGAGERAGVINSYFQAYGKLPNSEAEWSDVLKIASGRWPTERNAQAKFLAKFEFKNVYLRAANFQNNIDENAIMVIAYGLLPLNRNLNSEKAAIKTFVYVYGHQPVKALAWNVVRAIAYSGAKR